MRATTVKAAGRGAVAALAAAAAGCAIVLATAAGAAELYRNAVSVGINSLVIGYVIGVIGFRSKELIFWRERFEQYCDELIICTDDGSAGIHGRVTDGLQVALDRHDDIDRVVAIGPPIMMKACAETTRPAGIETIVSMNPIVVDGTGMCGGCRVTVGNDIKFACVDGPEFDAHKVDFDELMNRLGRYRGDEKTALETWKKVAS